MSRSESTAHTETWYVEDFICLQCGEPADHGLGNPDDWHEVDLRRKDPE